MAYFLLDNCTTPNKKVLSYDEDKTIENSQESLQETMDNNYFGLEHRNYNLSAVFFFALNRARYEYKFKPLKFYFYLEKGDSEKARAFYMKKDFIRNNGELLLVREWVIEHFEKHAAGTFQAFDAEIKLPDGSLVGGFKVLYVYHIAPLFMWDKSIKWDHYVEGEAPEIANMQVQVMDGAIIERERACKDSVTEAGKVYICDALAKSLKKIRGLDISKGMSFLQIYEQE